MSENWVIIGYVNCITTYTKRRSLWPLHTKNAFPCIRISLMKNSQLSLQYEFLYQPDMIFSLNLTPSPIFQIFLQSNSNAVEISMWLHEQIAVIWFVKSKIMQEQIFAFNSRFSMSDIKLLPCPSKSFKVQVGHAPQDVLWNVWCYLWIFYLPWTCSLHSGQSKLGCSCQAQFEKYLHVWKYFIC